MSTEEHKEIVTLTVIENPLEMEHTRTSTALIVWGQPVISILPEKVKESPENWVIINDGRELTISECTDIMLHPGGEVICYPRIRGKHTGIAVGFALIIAGAVVSAFGFPAFGISLVKWGFITIALNMAYMALAPHPPDAPDTSITYGFGGIRNDTRIGSPIPVVYGEHRVGGHYIEIAETVANGDTDNNELYLVLALSEGEIEKIDTTYDGSTLSTSSIEINGQSIANYSISHPGGKALTGTNDQDYIFSKFGGAWSAYSVDTLITPDWFTYVTQGTNITGFQININFPMGLYRINKDGETKNASVTFDIEYRLVGTPTWTPDTVTYTASKMAAVRRYTGKGNGHDGTGETYLPPGQYEIRMKRADAESTNNKKVDQAKWDLINEIVNDRYKHPNVALFPLDITATDQLSGGLPTVTTIIKGRKIRVYTTTSAYTTIWSDNPAWVVLDMLTNTRYGMGIADADIYIQSFIDWAAYCNEMVTDGQGGTDKRATCNIVFDSTERFWDAALKVCAIGYAMLVKVGNKIQVKIEKQETPVQLFTMANIKRGSFKENFMSLQNRSNVFEIQYLNKDNSYLQDMVTIEDPAIYSNAEPIKKQTVQAYGITRTSHAVRFARYLANINRYITRAIQFEVDIDAIACEPGDVIRFQHDVPQWGFASRAAAGATASTIVLDTAMVVEAGKTYQVLVRHSDDTVEIKTVTNTAGTYTTLTISGTWTQNPADGDVVAFGETDILVKPFRIVSIERTEDMRARVSAIEYSASVYDDSNITPVNVVNYSVLPNPNSMPPQVTDLTLSQINDDQHTIAVTFTPPNDYRYATTYIYSIKESVNVKLGESRDGSFYIHDTPPGTQLTIKAVSISRTGSQADISQSPSATITVTVTTGNLPPDVTGLELVGQGNDTEFVGKDAKFQWRNRGRTSGFGREDIGYETLGAGAGGIDPFFRNYRVEIYNTDGTTLRRRDEYVVDPSYTYGYEKNYEDAQKILGDVVRSFMIKVWQQDTFNQMSGNPAVLVVSNQSPAIVNNLKLTAFRKLIILEWDKSPEPDIEGYKVWRSTTSGFSPDDTTNLEYEGYSTVVQFDDVTPGTVYYFKVAAYDSFGEDGLNISGEVSGNPEGLISQDVQDLAITLGKIADGAISTAKLADMAVTVGKIVDGAITELKIDTNAITSTKIADNAITTPKLIAGAITTSKIYAGAITANEIAAEAVVAAKIAAGAVIAGKIDANAVTANEIAAGSVTTAKIVAEAITATELAADSVTAVKILAGSVTADKISVTSLSAINATIGNVRSGSLLSSTMSTKGGVLTVASGSGNTTITLSDTSNFGTSGNGQIIDSTNDRDDFSWTGKTSTTLTGCSGVLAHNVGALVIPLSKVAFINDAANELRLFGDRGDGTIEELASIGINYVGSDYYIGVFGSTNTTLVPILTQGKKYGLWSSVVNAASSDTGSHVCNYMYVSLPGWNGDIHGLHIDVTGSDNSTSYDTRGLSVVASAASGGGFCIAMEGISTGVANGIGGRFGNSDVASGGPIQLIPSASAAAPTHAALKGTLWVTSSGILYICYDNFSSWQKVGAQ